MSSTVPSTLSNNRWRVCLVQLKKNLGNEIVSWSLRKLAFLNVFITDKQSRKCSSYIILVWILSKLSPLLHVWIAHSVD